MFEPLNLFLSLLAVGLALYAVCLARKTWQTVEAEGPLALWEEEVAELSEDLARAAQQITAHLSRRREELSALLVKAENVAHGLQMSEAKRAEQVALTDEAQADETAAGLPLQPSLASRGRGRGWGLAEAMSQAAAVEEPSEVNHRIRLLASQGISVAEIARQTRLSQEEIAMRLSTPA